VCMHGKPPVRQLLAYAQTTLLILGQDLLASFNYYQSRESLPNWPRAPNLMLLPCRHEPAEEGGKRRGKFRMGDH
jgi:hypothetical protein